MHEDNWDRGSFRPQNCQGWCTCSKENVRRFPYKFPCERAHPFNIAGSPTIFELQIAAVLPSKLMELFQKCSEAGMPFRIALGTHGQHADPLCTFGLLRARSERPGRCAAEQRDELAASHHSITSSARASRVGGTSRPSAFAVVRLTTSSNLVGCMTGRSAGFPPLRIRPV